MLVTKYLHLRIVGGLKPTGNVEFIFMGHNKETPPKMSYSNTIGCISGHSTDIMILLNSFPNNSIFLKSVGELINDEVQIYFKAQ